jgi:hypothetical protein
MTTATEALKDAIEKADMWDFSEYDNGIADEILAHLSSSGWSLVRTEGLDPELRHWPLYEHRDDPRCVCVLCGPLVRP